MSKAKPDGPRAKIIEAGKKLSDDILFFLDQNDGLSNAQLCELTGAESDQIRWKMARMKGEGLANSKLVRGVDSPWICIYYAGPGDDEPMRVNNRRKGSRQRISEVSGQGANRAAFEVWFSEYADPHTGNAEYSIKRHAAMSAWQAASTAALMVGQSASIGDDPKFIALLDWALDAYKLGAKVDASRFDTGIKELCTYIDSRPRSEDSRVKVLADAITALCPDGKVAPGNAVYMLGFRDAIAKSSALASTPPKADNDN